ncbi:MAG TPA: hypothetical protein PLV51_03605 [Lentimicrobium sp.]|nr:hypothetical protein [Lentimicrobium sp.]
MSETVMQCRPGCAACCIYPSISSAIPGMPGGKPPMVPCIQLTADLKCALFGQPSRPAVCSGFKPEEILCGNSNEEAEKNFSWLLSLPLK